MHHVCCSRRGNRTAGVTPLRSFAENRVGTIWAPVRGRNTRSYRAVALCCVELQLERPYPRSPLSHLASEILRAQEAKEAERRLVIRRMLRARECQEHVRAVFQE